VDYDQALRTASVHGHLAVVEALLAAGADVHACDEDSLYYAAAYGHVGIVKALLDAGAEKDCVLRRAYRNERQDVLKMLTEL